MGPRSDNRGYVFMLELDGIRELALQWVHGRITVVMNVLRVTRAALIRASMGPRSDNRGYDAVQELQQLGFVQLQWVHGRITVVELNRSAEVRGEYRMT